MSFITFLWSTFLQKACIRPPVGAVIKYKPGHISALSKYIWYVCKHREKSNVTIRGKFRFWNFNVLTLPLSQSVSFLCANTAIFCNRPTILVVVHYFHSKTFYFSKVRHAQAFPWHFISLWSYLSFQILLREIEIFGTLKSRKTYILFTYQFCLL